MENKKIKEWIEKLSKDKKIMNVLVALLVIIMLYFVTSYFTTINSGAKTSKDVFNSQQDNQAATDTKDTTNNTTTSFKDYEEQEKAELKNILRQIDGVGNVDVKIYVESGEEKVPALDTTVTKSTTEETDKDGGKRINNQQSDGDKVVITTNGKGNEPLIVKVNKPKITGVVVVAEGAENSKIKYEISKAVANLYGLTVDKISVFSMKK